MTKRSAESAHPAAAGGADWPSIHGAYRAGVFSIRELARHHHVSDRSIRKRAKREGWQRDLAEQVQEAARAGILRGSDPATPAGAGRTGDAVIVAEWASIVMQVLQEHRRLARVVRSILGIVLHQLDGVIRNRAAIEVIIREETAESEDPNADRGAQKRALARREKMLDAVGLGTHAKCIVDLAVALDKCYAVERQAYGLDDFIKAAPANEPTDPMADESLAAYAAQMAGFTRAPTGPGTSPPTVN